MNTITKIILVILMIVAGALWNTYGQVHLDGTQLAWFPFAKILLVPTLFIVLTPIYKKKGFTPMKLLAMATAMMSVYAFVGDLNHMERIIGNVLAILLGAFIVFLVLFFKSRTKA